MTKEVEYYHIGSYSIDWGTLERVNVGPAHPNVKAGFLAHDASCWLLFKYRYVARPPPHGAHTHYTLQNDIISHICEAIACTYDNLN